MAGMFGTDGVRARINTGPMTAEAVVRLALAAGRWFVDNNAENCSERPKVVIGKDTRLSGYMLELRWWRALLLSAWIAACLAPCQHQRRGVFDGVFAG